MCGPQPNTQLRSTTLLAASGEKSWEFSKVRTPGSPGGWSGQCALKTMQVNLHAWVLWPRNLVKVKEQRMKNGQNTSKMAQTRTQRTYMGSGLHRTPLAAAAGFGPGGEWLRRGRGWSSVHLARNWLDLFLKSACINLVN